MKKRFFSFLLLWPLLYMSPAWPEGMQSHVEIHKAALDFIQTKTQNMAGKITFKVDDIDPRISFPACSRLEAFLPAGAQMQGRTSIGVRCTEKNGWSLFLPATISVTMDMLISSRPLQQGLVIGAGDFSVQSGELNQPGIITDQAQILGKVLKYSISAGQVLKQDMFRPPYAVIQGQTVQLIAEGNGVRLRTEGQALNNAAEGQAAQVRVSSGQVISGTAKENGIVEVRQ
jgi:flagella basal body P-ring formation protein FlgA